MPNLESVAELLRRNKGRYEFLDAFADDVDELRSGSLERMPATETGPAEVALRAGDTRLFVRLFPEQGIARFRMADQGAPTASSEQAVLGAALGALIGAAVSSASKKKEGLLDGLVVGMLVGGLVGAASQSVERVLALRFEPATGAWQLYDGPLLRWAKRTLHPLPPAA